MGKTSILTRFTYEKFNGYSEPTLGAAFLTKKHTLPTGKSIEYHIWDTAGQEKYRSIAPIYYREAKIALCVYDITSQRSYEVMKKWVEELQANGPKDIVLAVVGNKIDRCDEEEVDYAMVKEYATSLGAILKLVSAKEGKNIEDLFNTVGEMAFKKLAQGTPANTGGQKVTNKKDKKKKSGCC